MKKLHPNKGRLLIAEPSLTGDLSFNRSVVLLAEHSEKGSVGFILNKILDLTLSDFIPKIPVGFKIYNGGPVEQDSLYFIHKVPDLIPGSIEISDGIYWGGDFDIVCTLIENKKISEKEIRFFLGYSGWNEMQLEKELEDHNWIIMKNLADKKLIEQSYTNFWKNKIKELGGNYLIWINAPEHPSYN